MDDLLPLLAVLIPLCTALLVPLVDLVSTRLRVGLCLLGAALTVVVIVRMAPAVFLRQETLVYWMSGWTPREGIAVGISLVVDAWGLLLAGLVAGLGTLTLVYSAVYLRHETGRAAYYVLFMLLQAALIGFVLSGDLFNQFVWLEVFSVAAFALTGYHYEERGAIEAAFKYLLTNSIAALFIATALCLFYMQTGALNLAHIARALPATPASLAAVGLLVAGYAAKAALVPWHFWQPDVYAAAPGPVTALFSGTVSKVGLYAMARTLFTLAPGFLTPPVQAALLALAALSILVGGLQMLHQGSVKRILAYSSVAQMGYALLGLAVGTPLGLAAAAAHLIHHALVKPALFMSAGMLSQRSQVDILNDGGGLARHLPVTTTLFCLGALSLSGLPLFSGFISKTMLEEAALHEGWWWLAAIAILGSVLTFAGMARLVWRVFFAPPLPDHDRPTPKEFPALALLPVAVLIAGSVAFGLFPNGPVAVAAWPAAHALTESEVYSAAVLGDAPAPASSGADTHPAEPPPSPYDWHHWWVPAIIILAGSALAYALNRPPPTSAAPSLARRVSASVAAGLRRWHSGIVNDYALWGTIGTTALVAVLVVSFLMR